LIVGNDAPTARGSVLVQENEIAPVAPLHIQPVPAGVAVRVIPAGNGSFTVVVEILSAPEPTFLISTV
jgi:hypothetical protein